MPRRNLLAIFAIVVTTIFCYQRVDHNPYGRYLSQVLAAINDQALEQVPRQELFDGAMDGIIGKLDEYSGYISARDAAEFEADLEQQFGGVGVMITLEENPHDPAGPKLLTIINPPLFGTPAREAGLQVGDRILKIDATSTIGLTTREASRLMRGPVGKAVALSVLREGETEPFAVTLERALIRVPSVLGDRPLPDGSWDFQLEQDPRIAYLRITSFGEKTASELHTVLDSLEGKGIEALILDLRDDAGGLLEAAVETCDMFLPADKSIVSIKGRGGVLEREYRSTGGGVWQEIPIAVLVNGYTASASEIVAACLQDHGRAVVVGTRTWGKGTVQHVLRIEAGKSLLKLTTASYWRPSGQNIHRMKDDQPSDDWGVTPDPGLQVELSEPQLRKLLEYRAQRDVVAREKPVTSPPSADPGPPEPLPAADNTLPDRQLEKAFEYLEEQLAKKL